jgi:hypothetical protein
VVKTILTIEPVDHTSIEWLYNNYRTIEVGLLVHVPDDPINECTEKIALAKLNDFLGHNALRSEVFV